MFESGAGSNYVDRRKADKMKKYGRKILFTLFVLAVLGLIGIMIYETRMFQITSSKRLQDLYGKKLKPMLVTVMPMAMEFVRMLLQKLCWEQDMI